MARPAGISADSVHKLWAANDLKPRLTRTFKPSNDPNFEDMFWDVIGLYIDKIMCAWHRHAVHGSGLSSRALISSIKDQHRHQEWLEFLKKINRETPKHLQLHLIVNNYATHKHPKVKVWPEKHKRFHMHFTSSSSSWIKMVERFFRDITVYLREGSISSVRELETSISTFMALRNAQPTRYVWNAKGEDILNKTQRAREEMASQANG